MASGKVLIQDGKEISLLKSGAVKKKKKQYFVIKIVLTYSEKKKTVLVTEKNF